MSEQSGEMPDDRRKRFRRELRADATKPEELVWAIVRNRRMENCKFRRQHSMGRWIVDFVCLEQRLVVELDGGYHDFTGEDDLNRQAALERLGFKLLRFSNEDVERDLEAVAQGIRNALKQVNPPSMSLLPSGEKVADRPDEGHGE
jgi:very-short-patch-repair endonuclease